MKKKDIQNLRVKKVEDLKKEAMDLMSKKAKTKVEILSSKEKDVKKVSKLARDLSQILTIIREKEIMGENDVKGKEEEKKK